MAPHAFVGNSCISTKFGHQVAPHASSYILLWISLSASSVSIDFVSSSAMSSTRSSTWVINWGHQLGSSTRVINWGQLNIDKIDSLHKVSIKGRQMDRQGDPMIGPHEHMGPIEMVRKMWIIVLCQIKMNLQTTWAAASPCFSEPSFVRFCGRNGGCFLNRE